MIIIFNLKINSDNFIKTMNSKAPRIEKEFERTAYDRLDLINSVTEPLVPYRTGRLRASVLRPNSTVTNGLMEQEITYSALDPRDNYDYAFIQHENTSFKHKVGGAKYLTKGLSQSDDLVMKELSSMICKVIEGGS